MATYRFKFQHTRSFKYLWLMLAGPVAGLGLAFFSDATSFVPVLAGIVLPILAGGYLLFAKGRAADEITMDGTGFTSLQFGRVEWADIVKVGSVSSLVATPPSMRLTLRSGQKIVWLLAKDGNYYNSKKDAEVFQSFAVALAGRLDAIHPLTAAAGPDEDTPAQQAREVVRRNNKNVWAIPLSIAVALVALVRTCGKEWFRSNDVDFARAARQSEASYRDNLEKAKVVMQQQLRRQGAAFLYTNDTAARVELLPDIDDSNPTGIEAFRHTKANENLRRFIEQPDSFRVLTVLLSGDESVKPMTPSRLNIGDSTEVYLYIRVYDPSQRIIPRGTAVADSASYPVFDLVTAVPLYDTLHVEDAIGGAFPGMRMMLAQVGHRPAFRLYLTGRESDGISESVFRRSVRELNRRMHAVEADTGRFVLKTFNR